MNKAPIDRLMDEGRILGESRMIAENTLPEQVTDEQAQCVRNLVNDYIQASAGRWNRTKVAKAIGCAATTLSTILNGNYPGNVRHWLIELDKWIEEQKKRDAAPRVNDFVWTTVAEEIKTVADAASHLGTIGLVYGPETSGMGKTIALKAIADRKPGSIYVSMEKAASSPTAMLQTIVKAMGLGHAVGRAKTIAYNSIKDRLAGSSRLLILDQIHSLCGAKDDLPFGILMDLHNETGAPQLWCGTNDIVSYLDRRIARGAESLTQINSRIMPKWDLMQRTREGDGGQGEPLYTLDEIKAVFAKNKMRLSADASRYLLELANLADSGALRTCTYIVRMATKVHERTATILTADLLKQIHGTLVRSRSYSLLQSKLASQQPRATTKVG
jgi:DNA transposition AAA+ family ATPase